MMMMVVIMDIKMISNIKTFTVTWWSNDIYHDEHEDINGDNDVNINANNHIHNQKINKEKSTKDDKEKKREKIDEEW